MWQDIAAVAGAIGGVIGGVIMPIVLWRMGEARTERARAFAELHARLHHLDECLDTGKKETREHFGTLKDQVNGLHLELRGEYVSKHDLRTVTEDLRAEIGVARQIKEIRDAFLLPPR